MGEPEIEPSEPPPAHLVRTSPWQRVRDLPSRVQIATGAVLAVLLLGAGILVAGQRSGDRSDDDQARLETVDGASTDRSDRSTTTETTGGERPDGSILNLPEEALRHGGGGGSGNWLNLPSQGGGARPSGPAHYSGAGLDVGAHFRRNYRPGPMHFDFELPDSTTTTTVPEEETTTSTTEAPTTTTTTPTTVPPGADLRIAGFRGEPEPTGEFTIQVRVRNAGPAAADALQLDLVLPDGATVTPGWQGSDGWKCSSSGGPSTWRCTLPTLAAETTGSLTITGTGAPATGTITATISAQTRDPNPTNNTATHPW